MSRLTGSEARGLMEAYTAMYALQEEVVEENEEKIDEDIKSFADKGGLLGAAQRAFSRSGTEQGKAQNRAAVGKFFSGINQGATKLMQTGGIFGRGGALDRALRKPADTPSSRPPASPGPADPAARPAAAAPAARPAAAKPAPTPAAKPSGSAMDQWRANFPKLAAKVTPAGTQRGTGQSTMAKQASELRSMQAASQERQAAQSGPMYSSPDVKSKMSARAKNILGVKEQHDAYDVVLEYLLSQGHVDTLEEALYVMMEMPAETIQSIIEQSNTLVTPEQRRADELKYGMRRTTQVPPSKPPASVKTGPKPPRMPL